MRTYRVEITEMLQKTVEVKANSRKEAEEKVEDQWKNCKHVLDAENFVGVEFKAISESRNRDYENKKG